MITVHKLGILIRKGLKRVRKWPDNVSYDGIKKKKNRIEKEWNIKEQNENEDRRKGVEVWRTSQQGDWKSSGIMTREVRKSFRVEQKLGEHILFRNNLIHDLVYNR